MGSKCEKIILQSPWIPMIDDNLDRLMAALNKVEIEIICGENDDDCLPYAKKLAEEAVNTNLTLKTLKASREIDRASSCFAACFQ